MTKLLENLADFNYSTFKKAIKTCSKLKCDPHHPSRVKQVVPTQFGVNVPYTALLISTSDPFSATGVISFEFKTSLEGDSMVNAGLSVNNTRFKK
jgi:hypothetical protein